MFANRPLTAALAITAGLISLAAMVYAAPPDPPPSGDYGDAPEGTLAYPASGVGGQFPTCYFGAPAGYIVHTQHADLLFFGPDVDFEFDGNAGICPPPAYDRDECLPPLDGDAGLIAPTPYTIHPGDFVDTCSGMPGTAIGVACSSIYAGPAFDIHVTSNVGMVTYANILIDWNQDGEWGGYDMCGPVQVDEWVLRNLPIPPGYSGALSGILPFPVQIGSRAGYVWSRFTCSERAMSAGWEGDGEFDIGETEDYLLRVDSVAVGGDYGDAPEDAPAYPSAGTMGGFPTCIGGSAGFVRHALVGIAYFGASEDFESDGNANVCPQPPYDEDECSSASGDAGLIRPAAYTLIGGVESTCPGTSGIGLGSPCQAAVWGSDIDIHVVNGAAGPRYLNVLMDWSHDGRWGGWVATCFTRITREHVLRNFTIPAGFSGPVSSLSPPSFTIGNGGYVWSRFTLGDSPVPMDWDGGGQFGDGETEDYLLEVGGTTSVSQESAAQPSTWGAIKARFE